MRKQTCRLTSYEAYASAREGERLSNCEQLPSATRSPCQLEFSNDIGGDNLLRRFRRCGGAKGLQREIAEAKAFDVFQLPLKFVLMSLFVGYQALE